MRTGMACAGLPLWALLGLSLGAAAEPVADGDAAELVQLEKALEVAVVGRSTESGWEEAMGSAIEGHTDMALEM